ncbi:IclR family transcriptional regulator [Woeseia oceani]|uniref:Transcriptional regulator KdgR n=1 Tax=Woeseia oceani TaxID=1548547 RepID=A0A193LDW9_9GAMM|nr:IclR family transcriptional regulator [Woeseia oceani]ANO50579.1 transcriptional regulator KdgR [Woeseia oceani]
MAKKEKSTVYRAPALDKGLEILELLADVKEPMTLTQIASVLNRSRSELYRMTAVLVERGYLIRDTASDALSISNRLFDLGMLASPVGTLVEAAFPTLHALSEATLQSCHLAVASGNRMVVIARVESPSSVGIAVRVGHHLDLYESGSGLTLLAWMDEEQRTRLLRRYSKQNGDIDIDEMNNTLDKARRKGYVRRKSSLVQSVEDLSCPVFMGDHEHVIACLTVPFLKGRAAAVPVADALQHLMDASKALSALSPRYGGF